MPASIGRTIKKNDEMYTPKILVDAIVPYIENWVELGGRRPIIWCPFDQEKSEFVYMANEVGTCVRGHISEGLDFFEYEPPEWDMAISNPPFSRKLDVFKRLDSLSKPWAMLCNMMAINYMEIGNYFADYPVQMLIPDKRVSFDGNPSSFCSGYFCHDLLPRDLIFTHLPHTNQKANFVPSRLY